MEWTGLNELREKYISFFESKGHLRLPSYPLVPQNDDTLLLINAGMAPMKNFFLGLSTPPAKRVVTCQKCIRTPDMERVGKTARHGTYFEMLGNFSFGDYFKREAIAWGWEFCTKVLEMPVDKLWVTIYQDDDEAFDIWTKEIGIDPSRVVRMGKEDNFWEHGSLPCGPCSEIYFDRGEEYGCGKPTCGVGCDCDRYVEFWNIVFQQFSSDGKGHYTRLAKPNIDTGLGLERLACIMQGVNNLFEVDTVQNIMKEVGRIAGVKYGEDAKKDISLRAVTDHIRSTVFMVGDGVLPSNEGRGYVLRRLLRRAARHGRLLGIKGPFLAGLTDIVIHENLTAYPELEGRHDYIKRVIEMEEARFSTTIDQGLSLLGGVMEGMKSGGQISGEDAFKLYDTFGFPLDLTADIAADNGLTVDEAGFEKLMLAQRERARAARSASGNTASDVRDDDVAQTKFLGYAEKECRATLCAMIAGGERVGIASAGDRAQFILDNTVFYAESGGQVGDSGVITTKDAVIRVDDCKKSRSGRFLHFGEVISGKVAVGDEVTAKIDVVRRAAIMRNHSAAHLLQAALRKVLGEHVHQAGQYVYDKRLRFDFSHFAPMTEDELERVEQEVNAAVLEGLPVVTKELPIEEAKKTGAMALFGEKYGDVVRVVSMGGYSTEFCGGTHVDNTAKLGLFHIVSESSVAAGVRRIEAATGFNIIELLNDDEKTIKQTAQALKAGSNDLAEHAAQVMTEIHERDRRIDSLSSRVAEMQLQSIASREHDVGKFKVITASFSGMNADALRLMTDRIREKDASSVAVLAGISDGKLVFVAACGPQAVKDGANAGKIVKAAAAAAGGGGGGRPDSATAGGKDVSKVDEALAAAEAFVKTIA